MTDDSQTPEQGSNAEDPFVGKWCEPIARELLKIEEEALSAAGNEASAEDETDSAPWAENCLLSGVEAFSDVYGLEPMNEIDARRLG